MLTLKRAYELDSTPAVWRPSMTAARRRTITLVDSSRHMEHNNAVALNDYLNRKIGKRHRTQDGTAAKPRLH